MLGLEGLNSGPLKSFILLGSGASCEIGTAGPLAISSFDMPRFPFLRPPDGEGAASPNGALELVLDLGCAAEVLLCVTVELVLIDKVPIGATGSSLYEPII